MLSRLMDLVVLVAELSQNSGKSFQELDIELLQAGYSRGEIDQAVFWFSSRGDQTSPAPPMASIHNAVRVLSDWERMSLSSDCYGFLLRLFNLGLIDHSQFENIIARCIPVGPEKIQLSEVKAIAGAVVFNRDAMDIDDDGFGQWEEDFPAT